MKNNMIITDIHIEDVQVGMTIFKDNELYTVGINDIKYCSFMGHSFMGDASKKVLKQVQFEVMTAKGKVLR